MKKYSVPHSLNADQLTGKEVNIIPALAGAVGALAGVAAAGFATEGGKAIGRKIFGDDIFMTFINNQNIKIEKNFKEYCHD